MRGEGASGSRVAVGTTTRHLRSVSHSLDDFRWYRVASATVKRSTRDDIDYGRALVVGERVKTTCTVMMVCYPQEIIIGGHRVDQSGRLLLVEHLDDLPRHSNRHITLLPSRLLLRHWTHRISAVAWEALVPAICCRMMIEITALTAITITKTITTTIRPPTGITRQWTRGPIDALLLMILESADDPTRMSTYTETTRNTLRMIIENADIRMCINTLPKTVTMVTDALYPKCTSRHLPRDPPSIPTSRRPKSACLRGTCLTMMAGARWAVR